MLADELLDHVSVILRLHDPEKLHLLQRALFSICNQRRGLVEPIIVLQNFADRDADHVREMAAMLPWQSEAASAVVVNCKGLGPGDHRSHLLNRGLDAGRGGYVAFLDYDDFLYPQCYEELVKRIEVSGNVAAVGGVTIADTRPVGRFGFVQSKRPYSPRRSKATFFQTNLYPIHSLVLRRAAAEHARFPEKLTRLEDYHFLLQIFSQYDWDDTLVETPLCEYTYWSDLSNSVSNSSTDIAWMSARRMIDQWKNDNKTLIPVSQVASLSRYEGGVSDTLEAVGGSLRKFVSFLPRTSEVRDGETSFEFNNGNLSCSLDIFFPASAICPRCILVYVKKSKRSALPSYRYLGNLSVLDVDDVDRSATFSGQLSVDDRILKNRDELRLSLVALCADRLPCVISRQTVPVHLNSRDKAERRRFLPRLTNWSALDWRPTVPRDRATGRQVGKASNIHKASDDLRPLRETVDS